MDIRSNFDALTKLMESGDKERYWQEYYSENIVRRLTGLRPLVGREACRRQVQEFIDGLTSTPQIESKTVAFDDENQISMYEFNFEFIYKAWGHIRQSQIHVQRWRSDRIFEETIYVMSLGDEAT